MNKNIKLYFKLKNKNTNINFKPEQISEINPVIVCLAKLESDYIEEFVKYHLALGFKYIYLYDNEDIPTYESLLKTYSDSIKVIHIPFNNYNKTIQYYILDHFIKNFLYVDNISHVAHIDIDEFIVLKKHHNICDFINEYIIGDCAGIGMNWKFFGSSNQTDKSNIPVTIRFTLCANEGNKHIKTLYNKTYFRKYRECHSIYVKNGYHIKSTNGQIITGPFNNKIDQSIIQLNHYKCKTLPEFRYIRTRNRADFKNKINEDVDKNFNLYNINEIKDLYAYNFYKKILDNQL